MPQSQRTQVLETTLQFLSHDDTSIHDYAIDMGADRALCLQLGYLDMMLNSSSPANDRTTNNIIQASYTKDQTLICWCLTRIYQCSRDYRLKSFHDIGTTDLVPILAKILKRHISQKDQDPSDSILVPVLKTLRVFARLETQVKALLLRWKDGRLIAILVDILNLKISTQRNGQLLTRHSGAAMESLGILKDLSFRLGNDDKVLLYGFLRDILVQYTTSHNGMHPLDACQVLEAVSAIYWNIATVPQMSLEMAQQSTVLKSLESLLAYKGTGDFASELAKIKRNALSAFGNIVSAITVARKGKTSFQSLDAKQTKAAAVFCGQPWIRPRLLYMLKGETDKDIQRRTMRTIRCLSSCEWGRSFFWKGQDLESFLAFVLEKKQDFDVPTRIQIYETIGCITGDKEIMRDVSAMLLKSLIHTITSFKDQQGLDEQAGLVAAVCKVLFLCLERNLNKPRSFPFCESFFAGIFAGSKIDPEQTHPAVARLLLIIATQEFGCQPSMKPLNESNACLLQNELLSSPVLDTIAELLRPVGPQFDKSQRDSLELIKIFLQDARNKKILADNERLLTALVGFALIAAEQKRKCAKQMILDLVPEL